MRCPQADVKSKQSKGKNLKTQSRIEYWGDYFMGKDDGKLCALLAYFLIGIVWYFADNKMKHNALAQFHVKQALVLFIASIILNALAGVVPFLGMMLYSLINLFITILWILGLVNAAVGKQKKLPIIGGFARHLPI